MKNNKANRLLVLLCVFTNICYAQSESPLIGVKTNVLSDFSSTLNLGAEWRFADNLSLDLSLFYNPWSFGNNKKMKHFFAQPEVRFWTCEAFNGHFFGLHLQGGVYNTGGLGFSDYMKDHRFEGWGAGGGLSYGYHWILSDRFSLEAQVGVGYTYLDYDVYPCEACGAKIKESSRHYAGPTKLGLSLIYMIK